MSSTERRNVVARIRREGREARHNNVSRQANPYLHSNAMPWLAGWDQADQDLRLEAEEDARASQDVQKQMLFEAGFKAALQYAKDEGWAYHPGELEDAVLAGNAWLAYELPDALKGEWK